jgi:5,6-dimethylbenzimidazole synthase
MMSKTPSSEAAAINSDEAMARYQSLLEVISSRRTSRAFNPDFSIPDEHYDLILDAARHAPSGANAQPWHFIVIKDKETKASIAEYFVAEQRRRAKLKMKFPTPNYHGLESAPGLIVVATDFRWTAAFPVLKNDDSDLNRMYRQNAERILLQSVAAATMNAHLAAAALGYGVWWVTAIGQEEAQTAMKPLLGIPEELSVLDIIAFGPPLKPAYKRWKKDLSEMRSIDKFDQSQFRSQEEIEDWVSNQRQKVMYRSEDNVD